MNEEIRFTQTENGLEIMTPYNTRITWFQASGEVDRKATIKSFAQFYSAELKRNLKRRAKCYVHAKMMSLRNYIERSAAVSR